MTIFVFAAFIAAVLLSVVFKLQLAYAMALGCLMFGLLAKSRGFSLREIRDMMLTGVKTSLGATVIFLLVGILTAAWRASGTISYFVYWGIRLIEPKLFLVCVFLILSGVSMLIGSSFGASGTLGVMLIVMARAGGVPELLAAGAIIAGAMVGDRGATVSSSANLVAAVTKSDLVKNVRRMFQNALVPYLATAGIFLILSVLNPLAAADASLPGEISDHYRLSLLCALPALIVLILPLFHIKIRTTMVVSLLTACLIAVFYQGEAPLRLLKALVMGYEPAFTGTFAGRIAGGGLKSMIWGAVVVTLASTFSGVFEKTGVLKGLEDSILKLARRTNLYTATLAVGTATSMVACSQTLSVILTSQMMQKTNDALNAEPLARAMNIEDSAIIVSGGIPWNICCSSQIAILAANPACLVFAFYVWLVPLWRYFMNLREAKAMRLKAASPALAAK